MAMKQPTIKEIARELGISVSTVSRALHDHPGIGLRTKMRVKELARALDYEPNQTAIFFQQRKTFTIGVILPELSETFFSSAVSGIEDAVYQHRYTVLMGQSHDSEEKEKQLVDAMRKHRVDGLLISVARDTNDYAHFLSLKKYHIPVVFFDRIPRMKDIHYVACDLEGGTFDAVNFLLKKGHRAIGLVTGPDSMTASGERLQGYIRALKKNRLKFDPRLVVISNLTPQSTRLAMQQLFRQKRKPTAIVVFNDYVGLDAVEYVRQAEPPVHGRIDFVSYSNIPLIRYTAHPPLASVEQFAYRQGQKASEILLDLLARDSDDIHSAPHAQESIGSHLVMNK